MPAVPLDHRLARLARRALPRLALALAILGAALATVPPAEAGTHSLTGPLPASVTALNYKISPDSRTVVFVADKDNDDVFELYAVPITGTTPIKLNPPLAPNGDVDQSRFDFTPDGQSVLYLAAQDVENRVELYRVPVAGGPAVKLSDNLVAGGNVTAFKIDGDSGRVVYLADQQANEIFELWSAPLAGGGSTKLNSGLVSGGDVGQFDIDPHSARVVYSADQETDNKYELYSVPIGGGSVVKLNPPIALAGGGNSGLYSEWTIDPATPTVVFLARIPGKPGGYVYSRPTLGNTNPLTLSFNLLPTQRILSFKVSPTGSQVVYNVGTKDGSTNAFKGTLHSNWLTAGHLADVTDTADPLYGTDNYSILPDGTGVVYTFQQNAASTQHLEAATMLGSRTPLYVPGVSDPLIYNFYFSADSQWVMYQTGSTYLAKALYTVPPGGGTSTPFGTGEFMALMPNSTRLLYLRAAGADNHSDLFSQQIFGGSERNLSRLFPAGYVLAAQASPDSHYVVYSVQINGQYELRVTDGAQAQPPLFLPLVKR